MISELNSTELLERQLPSMKGWRWLPGMISHVPGFGNGYRLLTVDTKLAKAVEMIDYGDGYGWRPSDYVCRLTFDELESPDLTDETTVRLVKSLGLPCSPDDN